MGWLNQGKECIIKIVVDIKSKFSKLLTMTKAQFSAALEIAKSDKDLSAVDDSILYGCGLPDFEPVHCDLNCVAKLLRWQVINLNGSLDYKEIDNMAKIAKRKFRVV